MKILFLSRWLPYPPANGSKIRIYNLLKQLARQGHSVDLITFYQQGENPSEVDNKLKEICATVAYVPYKPFNPSSLKALRGFFSPLPRSVIDTFQPEMDRQVLSALTGSKYEALVASEIDMAIYGLQAGRFGVPSIFEELEVSPIYEQFQRSASLKARVRSGLTWLKLKNYLRRLAKSYREITVVSNKERELVSEILKGKTIPVLPNGTDLDFYWYQSYDPAKRKLQLVFNGALTFKLNYEGIAYFIKEIFPLVKQKHPGLKLVITGNHRGVDLAPLRDDGVVFTGFLEDIRPTITESIACVVPLLSGGGTRLKILEALALGTPVVATPKGAEGLQARHGEHLLIASNPEDFALSLTTLLSDPALTAKLSESGRTLVERNYSWDITGNALNNLLLSLK